RFDGAGGGLDGGGIGYVAREDERPAAEALDLGGGGPEAGLAPGDEADPRAAPGERADNGPADPGRRAGNHDDRGSVRGSGHGRGAAVRRRVPVRTRRLTTPHRARFKAAADSAFPPAPPRRAARDPLTRARRGRAS